MFSFAAHKNNRARRSTSDTYINKCYNHNDNMYTYTNRMYNHNDNMYYDENYIPNSTMLNQQKSVREKLTISKNNFNYSGDKDCNANYKSRDIFTPIRNGKGKTQGNNPNHLNRVIYNPYRTKTCETDHDTWHKLNKVDHKRHNTKNNRKNKG